MPTWLAKLISAVCLFVAIPWLVTSSIFLAEDLTGDEPVPVVVWFSVILPIGLLVLAHLVTRNLSGKKR